MRGKAIAVLLLPLLLAGCASEFETAAQQADRPTGEQTMLDELYSQLLKSSGKKYAEARDELLKQPGVKKFLGRARANAPTGSEERWLAGILLARIEEPDEYKNLERVFVEKSSLCVHSGNVRAKIVSPVPYLADESFPPFKELLRRNISQSRAEDEQAFLKAQQLPESPLWADFLGEIAMKGWALPPVEQRLFEGGKLWTGSLRGQQHPTFSEDETLCHVVTLLGKLKERRARAAIERTLTDPKRNDMLRLDAAVVLRQFADARSLDALMFIIEDNAASDPARKHAIFAIGAIGGEKATQALQHILNTPTLKDSKSKSFAVTAQTQLKQLKKQEQQTTPP